MLQCTPFKRHSKNMSSALTVKIPFWCEWLACNTYHSVLETGGGKDKKKVRGRV